MSVDTKGNQPYVLIVGEGVHDAVTVEKILKLRGFERVKTRDSLPQFLQKMIPNRYPVGKGNTLNHFVPHPSFLWSKDGYAVVSNAGGKE